jgi:hypothetical protein
MHDARCGRLPSRGELGQPEEGSTDRRVPTHRLMMDERLLARRIVNIVSPKLVRCAYRSWSGLHRGYGETCSIALALAEWTNG